MEKLGGRKFVGFLVVALLFTVLVLFDKVSANEFVQFITLNFTVYVGGNAIEHLAEKI